MANNKWLNDLKTLKATTNSLRNTLRNKNVAAYDTDTLQTLVGKVPNLAPIEIPENEKWQPDPLWKFPDPNGSGEMKTIRQIYDEDTMANDYEYRAIFQITDDYDTIDLKLAFGASTKAQTFVLSDGTVYTNDTNKNLLHTWNKEYDVEDSKGRKMRYIRYYSDTSGVGYITGVYKSIVWVIYNGSTSITSTISLSDATMPRINSNLPYLECVEFEDKVTYVQNLPGGNNFKKLVLKNGDRLGASTAAENKISELVVYSMTTKYITSPSNTTSHCFSKWLALKYIDFSNFTPSDNTLYVTSGSSSTTYNWSVEELRGLDLLPLKTLELGHFAGVLNVSLPNTLENLTITSMINLRELILPENLTTFKMQGVWDSLQKLQFNDKLTSITMPFGGTTTGLFLQEVIVPTDFNISISLKSCISLTHDCLVNMLNNLKDLTGDAAKTLTLGTTNLAKLTDEEKAIATNKNWTLS